MNRMSCLTAGLAMTLALPVFPLAAQTLTATYSGYRGDAKIWTDVVTTEGTTKIVDALEGLSGEADREAVRYPGAEDGELYNETVNGLPGYRVVVKDGFVYVYEGQGMAGMVMLEDPPLVFDPSYPSHYGVLLAAFGDASRGSRKIPVVIPQKGDYCTVGITRKDAVPVPMGESSVSAREYEFRIGLTHTATVWTIDDAVAAVYLPAREELMVDAKYPMLQDKIRMIVKRAL